MKNMSEIYRRSKIVLGKRIQKESPLFLASRLNTSKEL